MGSRKYYLFFLASSIFSASLSIAMEEPNKELPPIQENRFTNAEELISFSHNLFSLAVNKQSKVVLSKASPDPLESMQLSLEMPEREDYCYHLFTALAMAHKDLGDQEGKKDPDVAIRHYMTSISFIEIYRKQFEKNILENIDKGAPLAHCIFIYQVGGMASCELGNLMLLKNYSSHNENSKFFYVKKFKESATYHEKVLSLQPNLPEKCQMLPEDLAGTKFNLYNAYASLMTYGFDQEKQSFLEKARGIHREFKNGSSEDEKNFSKFTTKSLEFLKQRNEVKVLSNRKNGSNKVKEIRAQNKNKMILSIHEDLDNSKEIIYPFFLQKIASKLEYLETLGEFKDYPEKNETIQYIEDRIKELLVGEQNPSSLYDIYERYMKLFSFKKLKENMIEVILPTYIERKDIEGALARVLVLAQLEKHNLSTLSERTRYTQAIIKNLAGDYEEWIAIEKELQEFTEKKRQDKQQQKQQREKQIIQEIKTRNDDSKAKPERKTINQQERKQGDNLQQTILTSIQANDIPPQERYEPSLSTSQAKKAKLMRHQEAQKEREARKDSLKEDSPSLMHNTTSTSTTTPTTTTNASSKEQDSAEQKVLLIRELYHLTKIAKKVDDEIENNTWTFTRENLIDYFEALGCKAEEGGRHKKLPLLKAIIVEHGGEIITVLNDFSGALTLPRWDQSFNNGQVPNYLRRQILEAREKMAILKIKANHLES